MSDLIVLVPWCLKCSSLQLIVRTGSVVARLFMYFKFENT